MGGTASALGRDGIGDARPALVFVVLLLCVDVLFMFLHVVQCCTDAGLSSFFSLEKERGFPEVYQYIKMLWAMLLLTAVAFRTRAPVHFGWALVLAYLLVDDAGQLHERLGQRMAATFDFQPMYGLRAQDFGELSVVFVAASVLLAILALTHYVSTAPARTDSRRLLFMLAALGVFGVLGDMLHSMAGESSAAPWWGLVEDGGEMVVVSAIAGFAFARYCGKGG